MRAYETLNKFVDRFLFNESIKISAEDFCNQYMDIYYDLCDTLVKEVDVRIYNIFDDINLLCDSYEEHEGVREADPHCIDEKQLKERLLVLRRKLDGKDMV